MSEENKKIQINVYKYKEYVGIEGINITPKGMGCIEPINKDNFKISQEAYDAITTIRNSNDDMGEVDCYGSTGSGGIIFGWMGPNHKAFIPSEIQGANDTDMTLLKDFIVELNPPAEFIELIDRHLEVDQAAAES